MKAPKKVGMDSTAVLEELRARSDPKNIEGMKRFGISGEKIYGIPVPILRSLARKIGRDHALAAELWASGIHEARLIATMVDEPKLVTEKQMEDWVQNFDSWDVCDQCCGNLFDRTEFAVAKAKEWSSSKEEFVRRAGFAMMAELAVHDKAMGDDRFEEFLTIIEETGGDDDRNFVKKAVNWALRQIGKRNPRLNRKAIEVSRRMLKEESKTAKWIATDALKELSGDAVQNKLKRVKN
jgi:3-methyladenine DNA glycosylase AlkD